MGLKLEFDEPELAVKSDGVWETITGRWLNGKFSITLLNSEFFFDIYTDCCDKPLRARSNNNNKCIECKKVETFVGKRLEFYPLAYGDRDTFSDDAREFVFNMLTEVQGLNPYEATVETEMTLLELTTHLERFPRETP